MKFIDKMNTKNNARGSFFALQEKFDMFCKSNEIFNSTTPGYMEESNAPKRPRMYICVYQCVNRIYGDTNTLYMYIGTSQ